MIKDAALEYAESALNALIVTNTRDDHYYRKAMRALRECIDSLAQASQARTDGGAVAWRWRFLSGNDKTWRHAASAPVGFYPSIVEAEPLYATPPGNATQAAGAREPLTDEQMAKILRAPNGRLDQREVAIVRMVEHLHGIASPAAELKKD